MPFTPKNYVDQVGPPIVAAWLNPLDVLANSVLAGAQTVPQVLAALGIVLPTPINAGGTGQTTAATALAALGGTTLAAVLATINQAYIGGQFYPQSQAEINAGSVVVNIWIPWGNTLRYGTNTIPGTTDMRPAIQAAVNQAIQADKSAAPVYLPGGQVYYVSGTVAASTGVPLKIYGDSHESSVIYQHTDAHVFNITATAASSGRLVLRDLGFVAINAGGIAMTVGAAIRYNGQVSGPSPVRTVDIRNVSFQGSASTDEFKYGIWITSANQPNIDNSIFNGAVGSLSSEHIHIQSDVPYSIAVLINNACTFSANLGINVVNNSNTGIENVTVTGGEHVGVTTGIIIQNTVGSAYVEPKITISNVHINSSSFCVFISQWIQVHIGEGCLFYRFGNLNSSAFVHLAGVQQFNVDIISVISDATDCAAVTLDGTAQPIQHGIIDGIYSGKGGTGFPVVNVLSAAGIASASQSVATPGVFATTAQTLTAGQPVYLTGSAPGGLALNTTYYVIAGGLTSTTCELAASPGGAGLQVTSSAVCTLIPISSVSNVLVRGTIRFGYTRYLPQLGIPMTYAPGGGLQLSTTNILTGDIDDINPTIVPTGTTPNMVLDLTYVQCGMATINLAAGTISTILGNRPGQRITLGCTNAGVVLANNASQVMPGGANFTFTAGQTIDLYRQAVNWLAVSRQ